MDGLQVSMVCLVLKMTVEPVTAQLMQVVCQTCLQGYFVRQNCTINNRKWIGAQCGRCTNCSAADQETVVECSTFADSVCRNKSAPVVTSQWGSEAAVSAPEEWILLTVIVLSVFLVLLGLIVTLLFCRNRHQNKLKRLDLL